MSSIIGYVLICKECDQTFVICKRCYRGHRYCSNHCRQIGYEKNRIKARKKYNSSPEALLDHRDRNRAYRLKNKKIVMDKTSKLSCNKVNKQSQREVSKTLGSISGKKGICISCKIEVFNKGVHFYGGPI